MHTSMSNELRRGDCESETKVRRIFEEWKKNTQILGVPFLYILIKKYSVLYRE